MDAILVNVSVDLFPHIFEMLERGGSLRIFTQADLRASKHEQYVDYNNKPLNFLVLLGLTTADVQVGKRRMKTGRIVKTRNWKRSLIGRDWLNQLNFRVDESHENSEHTNSVAYISERQDTEKLKQKTSRIILLKGKKRYKFKLEFKNM